MQTVEQVLADYAELIEAVRKVGSSGLALHTPL